jgi:hypothetical protein
MHIGHIAGRQATADALRLYPNAISNDSRSANQILTLNQPTGILPGRDMGKENITR